VSDINKSQTGVSLLAMAADVEVHLQTVGGPLELNLVRLLVSGAPTLKGEPEEGLVFAT
jgi:hypothetical protein